MTDNPGIAALREELERVAPILESRDLEIAEFHAMQLPVARIMRQCLAALSPAAQVPMDLTHDDLVVHLNAQVAILAEGCAKWQRLAQETCPHKYLSYLDRTCVRCLKPNAALAERGQDQQSDAARPTISSSGVREGSVPPASDPTAPQMLRGENAGNETMSRCPDPPVGRTLKRDTVEEGQTSVTGRRDGHPTAPAPPESGIVEDLLGASRILATAQTIPLTFVSVGIIEDRLQRARDEIARLSASEENWRKFSLKIGDKSRELIAKQEAEVARWKDEAGTAWLSQHEWQERAERAESELARAKPVLEAARASAEDADDGDLSPFVQRRLMRLREAIRALDKERE